ncbi:DUF2070 family protein [Acidianus sp.]|uniref:DUF2070 family protein n=1 Tax=Acidianus sp. TaxID=1872104 RepID=UPI00397A2814
MDSEKLTRKYYSKLISLPNARILLSIDVIEGAIIAFRGLEIGILFFYSFLIYSVSLLAILGKRIRTTLTLISIFSAVYLILSLFPIPYVFIFGTFIPLVNYSILVDYNEKISVTLASIASLIPSIILADLTILGIVYVIAVGVSSYIYVALINRKGNKIVGISSLKIVRPFLRALNYNKSTELEEFLDKISIPNMLNILTVKINETYLILPQIHFGMYGEIGSSKFPYHVEEVIPNSFVFHGPGSHEIDLTSSKESKRIAQEILNTRFEKANFTGITQEMLGDFKITTLNFDKFTLSFVERPLKGIDDLPGALWRDMISTNNFLVDCHNETLIDEIGRKEYVTLKNFIYSKERYLGNRKLKIGYAEGEINCEGLCKNKVRVLSFYSPEEDKKVSIIYLYANNACHGLREKIEQNLSDLTNAILVTPDDHSCTAMSFGNLYQPATLCEQLIISSRELVKESLEKMEDVKNIEYGILKVKTRVIGKVVSSMVDGLEKVGGFAMKTFWIPIILPYVILVVFLFIHEIFKI